MNRRVFIRVDAGGIARSAISAPSTSARLAALFEDVFFSLVDSRDVNGLQRLFVSLHGTGL
jgi:hypothetical protein